MTQDHGGDNLLISHNQLKDNLVCPGYFDFCLGFEIEMIKQKAGWELLTYQSRSSIRSQFIPIPLVFGEEFLSRLIHPNISLPNITGTPIWPEENFQKYARAFVYLTSYFINQSIENLTKVLRV